MRPDPWPRLPVVAASLGNCDGSGQNCDWTGYWLSLWKNGIWAFVIAALGLASASLATVIGIGPTTNGDLPLPKQVYSTSTIKQKSFLLCSPEAAPALVCVCILPCVLHPQGLLLLLHRPV